MALTPRHETRQAGSRICRGSAQLCRRAATYLVLARLHLRPTFRSPVMSIPHRTKLPSTGFCNFELRCTTTKLRGFCGEWLSSLRKVCAPVFYLCWAAQVYENYLFRDKYRSLNNQFVSLTTLLDEPYTRGSSVATIVRRKAANSNHRPQSPAGFGFHFG
jgi:hypothetical protein